MEELKCVRPGPSGQVDSTSPGTGGVVTLTSAAPAPCSVAAAADHHRRSALLRPFSDLFPDHPCAARPSLRALRALGGARA